MGRTDVPFSSDAPSASASQDRWARAAAAAWLLTLGAAALAAGTAGAQLRPMYPSLGLVPSRGSAVALALAAGLEQPAGIVAFLAATGLSLLPLLHLTRSEARRLYGLATLLGLVGGTLVVALVVSPLFLDMPGCGRGEAFFRWRHRFRVGLPVLGSLTLSLAAVQAWCWLAACWRLWRSPVSNEPLRELTLAVVVAAAPATLAAAVAGPVGAAVGEASPGAVVPRAVTFAATAASVVLLGAVWLRLRSAGGGDPVS